MEEVRTLSESLKEYGVEPPVGVSLCQREGYGGLAGSLAEIQGQISIQN